MSAIKKRVTVSANGTPDAIVAALNSRPEGVPADAVVIAVEVHTYEDRRLVGADIVRSILTLTLEWPDD